MTNISPEVRNYFKLELLVTRSCVLIRQLFKKRYSLFNGGKVWDDSSTCGSNYSTNVIAKNKKISLTAVQKTSISNGDSSEWDVTTLTALLINTDRPKSLSTIEIQEFDNEDKLLKQLRDIRNKLAHHPTKSLTDPEFNQLWAELSGILVAFGDVDTEIDKLKEDSVFESCTESINEDNVKEASRLNSLGTQAHKNRKFSEAITLFTKATVLPGVSEHDRATFYSNMASTRLALYEEQASSLSKFVVGDARDPRYRALQDAKQARLLWPTWWKGHFRVGKVYGALNEHEKAINSLERALALSPTNNAVQKALYESRAIHGRQERQEHLDPRLQPRTMDEHLNGMQKSLGKDPQMVRMGHNLSETMDPSGADVFKGHQYELGDIDIKQDYEQAAKYFAKAASQGNAEGMYNLARLTDCGLGVKKDHSLALKLYEQAASQPPQHPLLTCLPNFGVAEAECALGLRYAEGVSVHKNLPTAAYWHQRAVDHGSAQSAHSLGLMYQQGAGVDKNLDKAEQLFQLSARDNDPNAMLTLAELLLDKNDLQMAQIWYNRACESGNIVAQTNRDMFERDIQQKQQSIRQCSPDALQMVNTFKNMSDSLKTNKTVHKQSNHSYINDYNVLNELANRGSITAKIMCDALDHFVKALDICTQAETLTQEQENTFVHELSLCYRLEHIVGQMHGFDMCEKVGEIVDRVLGRCSTASDTVTSELDEDARICYAILHMDSYEEISKFLVQCKKKYPKSIHFFELSAATNMFLKRYEKSLYDANVGLEIDVNYHELLHFKAAALRLIGKDMDETIEAYKVFLAIAPKDHRKVPESYYAMASCYLALHKHEGVTDIVKRTYQQGEEAEKIQLPCFLPYESNSKTLLKYLIDTKSLLNTESTPVINRNVRLTDPHRIEVIKNHRDWESSVLQMKNNSGLNLISNTYEPRVQQQTAKSLIGLKSISLREMNPARDHVYNGYVLSVTIIEEAYSWIPSIHLVVEDEHLDCERMSIYGFPEAHGEYLTSTVYKIGSKMHIINPYLRLGAHDRKALIRIDDFSSIIMHKESERVVNMCQCCGKANAQHVCSKCKQARYCTKECQTMDWQLYKHTLICRKQ